jgi:phosphate transport system permease protein
MSLVQESAEQKEVVAVRKPQEKTLGEVLFKGSTAFFAYFILVLIPLILITILLDAKDAFAKFGFGFIIGKQWDPVSEVFGAYAPILGTLITSFIAMLIAVPVSFGIAVFVTELAPLWMRTFLSSAIELLAGIPSVIFGIWGLFAFAPEFAKIQPQLSAIFEHVPLLNALFTGPPMGIGMLTAGIILAIMTIPFISAVMREVFLATPQILKESAYGVGATTWEVVWNIVLPYTSNGLLGGIFLGLGRALGETMAVTFVIGNAHELTTSLFMPGTTISAVLANEFSEATTPMYKSSLLALGLILFLITFTVLFVARTLLGRIQSKAAK